MVLFYLNVVHNDVTGELSSNNIILLLATLDYWWWSKPARVKARNVRLIKNLVLIEILFGIQSKINISFQSSVQQLSKERQKKKHF